MEQIETAAESSKPGGGLLNLFPLLFPLHLEELKGAPHVKKLRLLQSIGATLYARR
ncbi:hypothetical protein [Bradyrhizobium sp. CCBAU 53340]|uniref:hypothetical protein n=1 Tax=Bradyrhizobium sp. CCBAU 53340 TaxID=1325112 RepID=UPI00188B34EB|nr:hypothetical protein [Bradyrhizobium sp. CCBAU 53340]